MTVTDVDLMDLDRRKNLDLAFCDPDGTDWRLAPHDDQAVFGALEPDPVGSGPAGSAGPAGPTRSAGPR